MSSLFDGTNIHTINKSQLNGMLKSKKLLKEDALRLRVAELKSRLGRGKDYTTLYIYEFGPQTKKQLDRIRMVWNLRAVDEDITKNLETIVSNMKQ